MKNCVNAADLVVYGKIYTSRTTGDYAEAFAVKKGKYIYVGNAAGAKEYIEDGMTEIIDRRGKGLVVSGGTEGHAHYIVASELAVMNALVGGGTPEEIVENIKMYVESNPNKKAYFVQGWETGGAMKEAKFTYNMRGALDQICSDKVIFMMDNVGHNAFMNSKAFEEAGFNKDTVIEGGAFSRDANGELLGLASDIAVNFAMENVIAKNSVISEEEVRKAVKLTEDNLHSCGYTNYFDAYSNFLGEETYKGIKSEDDANGLTVNIIGSYKIDSYANIDQSIATAEAYMHKYDTKHFKANVVKLFADGGAVEVKTGWMLEPYADGSHGNQVWPTEKMDEIVRKSNEKGLSVHVHTSGDGGTTQTVEAFVKAAPTAAKGVLNGIAHCRHITEKIKDKMAEYHVYSATNVNWRYQPAAETREEINETLMDYDLYMQGYPMKSLLDRGVVMTAASDFPATDGAPYDICGVIEIGVNGTLEGVECTRMDEKEYLTVEEMLDVFTINGAKQFSFADERGSVETGKYADFIFIDKDITTCAKDKIHEGKVDTVYFEGKRVYTV